MRISYSGQSMYSTCPYKYKLHYIERLRGPNIPSPLFFGSALDEAFSHLLATKKLELSEEELTAQLTETPETIFEKKMLEITHNGEVVKLSVSPFAEYFASDFSPELINKNHLKQLQSVEKSFTLVDFLDFHEQSREILKAKQKLDLEDKILYNYMNWLSLVEKGKLMISAYRTDILPQISEVFSIQKKVSIFNESGDEINGLIDFTASFADQPDTTYVCDNKTSSKPYQADSVVTSEQLSTYCEAENLKTAAYVVIEKKLFKNSPKIRSQIIKSAIPEETFQKTFDNFEKTVYNIENGNFPKDNSGCFAFGRTCEFYRYCKHGKKDGLVQLEKK